MSKYSILKKELKAELKDLAQTIRTSKVSFKDEQRSKGGSASYKSISDLSNLKHTFRHKHIAYCMFRGRAYEEVEKTCREDNKPNMDMVNSLVVEYLLKSKDTSDEALCVSA